MQKIRLIVKNPEGKTITSMDMPTQYQAEKAAIEERRKGNTAEVKPYFENNPWD